MKPSHLPLLIATIIVGLAVGGIAQSSSGEQMRNLTQKLQLTEKQKVQMAPLVEHQFKEMKSLKDDTSMGKLQKLRRARELQANFHSQASKVLSPEQMKKLEQMQAERRGELGR
ncbi:MAG: hypothetical protein JO076_00800 [Verrucomicrobia bacterium]|nr:hypothetical protein [Verrucomicrobiota bacterium]